MPPRYIAVVTARLLSSKVGCALISTVGEAVHVFVVNIDQQLNAPVGGKHLLVASFTDCHIALHSFCPDLLGCLLYCFDVDTSRRSLLVTMGIVMVRA